MLTPAARQPRKSQARRLDLRGLGNMPICFCAICSTLSCKGRDHLEHQPKACLLWQSVSTSLAGEGLPLQASYVGTRTKRGSKQPLGKKCVRRTISGSGECDRKMGCEAEPGRVAGLIQTGGSEKRCEKLGLMEWELGHGLGCLRSGGHSYCVESRD